MGETMKTRKAQCAVVLAAGALALSACSSGSNERTGKAGGPKASVQNFAIGTAADSKGPATAVPGAKKGGTVTDLEPSGLDYLDPGQIYVSKVLAVGTLYNRSLTGYRIDPKTGTTTLVGDLATDTGKPSDGGRTWTYTLKEGLKYEDGTPVTAKDVKYGVERLYAGFQTQGPTYVQTWLSGTDYRKTYDGPYGGKSLPDSLIAAPDARTVVFHFKAPHADAPYAMAMPNISPVPKAKDTGQGYNNHPIATGPYRIGSYKAGKSLVFVRNEHWDPKTDPIRNAYPDRWNLQLGIANPGLTQRLMGQSGQDRTALSLSQSADPSQMTSLLTSRYKSRTVNEYQPYVETFTINTKRVKDVRVRKAIAYAFPMRQVQQALGGSAQGDLGTTLVGPTIAGWKKSDPFGKLSHPTGDMAKAKELLKEAGQPHPKLVLPYANEPKWANVSLTVQRALAKAGFDVVRKQIDDTSYYTLISKVDNPYDIFRTSWGADWPNGSTVIPPTQDGRLIGDGSNNYAQLDDPYVNKEIDRIQGVSSLSEQSAEWMKLSDHIVANDVNQIPFLYDKYFQIHGSGLGGITYNQVYGTINTATVYVK
jgi:peptide/nickel transport system substrate-binding protein